MSRTPKLYLAGPEVFLPDPHSAATIMKIVCERHGATGLFPLDAEMKGLEGPDLARAIRQANVDLIREADGIVANMIPFRGPSMDVGTAYEMGVANALGKIVVGYTADQRSYAKRVASLVPVRHRDGVLADESGMAVEDFDLLDNLMMACGAAAITESFEAAVAHAVELVIRHQARPEPATDPHRSP